MNIELKVTGMKCTCCENVIKNSLVNIDGVKRVEADYKEGVVKIDTNVEIDLDLLRDKINNLGFEVIE